MSTGAVPGPVRRFLAGLADLRAGEAADMEQVGRLLVELADERALRPGDVATLVPPDDVHNHGHVPGSGPSPYSLILLCDTC